MNGIVAHIGGCGNHIRWLCLLDQTFDISSITKKDKFDFILNEVYGKDRTWHNWLTYEWKWRELLNKIFYIANSLEEIKNNKCPQLLKKILFINTSGENCYKHYVKFNSNLNQVSKDFFLESINFKNKIYTQIIKKQRIKYQLSSVNFNDFYKNSLTSEFIEKINAFFNIKIPFKQAIKIHDKWLELNNKAETEIIKNYKKSNSKNMRKIKETNDDSNSRTDQPRTTVR